MLKTDNFFSLHFDTCNPIVEKYILKVLCYVKIPEIFVSLFIVRQSCMYITSIILY